MNDEFYIGWEDHAPAGHSRSIRRLVAGVFALVLAAGAGFGVAQRLIGRAQFEWGQVRDFRGTLYVDPYPHLVLARPESLGAPGSPRGPFAREDQAAQAAPLVASFKFGLNRAELASLVGRAVTLRATRIHRDGRLLLEVEAGSVRSADPPPGHLEAPRRDVASGVDTAPDVFLGRQTFRGEIVDSKCWMGVMNPGVLKPHRACAVRCISGGIPPMLLVRREGASALNLLLVDARGHPVNDAVLDYVAEPVEITGDVVRRHDLLLLRAQPETYRRIGGADEYCGLRPGRQEAVLALPRAKGQVHGKLLVPCGPAHGP